MACGDVGKRLVSIAHGAVSFGSPIGGGLQETIGYIMNRAGTRKSACVSMDEYDLEGRAKFRELRTPIVRGTQDALVYTIQKLDESGNVTVTAANMIAGANGMQFDSAPFDQEANFKYNAGNVEAFAPLSVA